MVCSFVALLYRWFAALLRCCVVGCCLLFVICYAMFIRLCALRVVRCLLFYCKLLFVVCSVLFVVVCCLIGVFCLLFWVVVRCLLVVVC